MRSLRMGFTLLSAVFVAESASAVNVTVAPTQNQVTISPLIYGANQPDGSVVSFTAWRSGGNRLSGYNWENNFSNAGSDWQQSSDTYLCNDAATCSSPAATFTQFVDAAKAAGAYSLLTLQMAGYVSADDGGTVAASEVAPSSRWKQVVSQKGSALSTTPDASDGSVYMDELVNFLVQRYGKASEGGVEGYCLDNEPDLWSGTHALIHPEAVGAVELVSRSVELAKAVKSVDPSAETFGFVSYGYSGYVSLQDAPDWNAVKGSHKWYVQYFLAEMAAASQAAGARLLDVLDLHFYSEARQADTRVQEGTTANQVARVQATRSLWDADYDYSDTDPTLGENSWITEWNDPIELIPRVRRYISDLYPGTKFAMSEYDFGGKDHISGGIAQADALGVFGKQGVYYAARWGESGSYVDAGFQLYLNYDGAGSRFGNISVQADSSDVVNVPAYASIDESDPSKLHLILINRNPDAQQTAAVAVSGTSAYGSGQAFGFDGTSSELVARGPVTVTDNAFTLELEAFSATHVVLTTGNPPPIEVGGGGTGGTGITAAGGDTASSGGSSADSSGAEKGEGSGCGCRVAQSQGNEGSLLGLLVGALLLRRRREISAQVC